MLGTNWHSRRCIGHLNGREPRAGLQLASGWPLAGWLRTGLWLDMVRRYGWRPTGLWLASDWTGLWLDMVRRYGQEVWLRGAFKEVRLRGMVKRPG